MTGKLKEKLGTAQMILVGIGEEFDLKDNEIKKEPYRTLVEEVLAKEEAFWLHPFIKAKYLTEEGNERAAKAYEALQTLLKEKDYFIVTTCMDGQIYKSNLDKERIVAPCGNFHLLKCTKECENHLTDRVDTDRLWTEITAKKGALETVQRLSCPNCQAEVSYNNVKEKNYDENGYLQKWQTYTNWLQHTLNKELCVLELGVGLTYPTVIRWPFEKAAFFNQKASFFRVHKKLSQLSEELKERGTSVEESAVEFLLK